MSSQSDALRRLGHALRDIRKERGFTQEELSHRSGVHRAYLGGLELGLRNPSVETLLPIVEALDVTLAEWCERAAL